MKKTYIAMTSITYAYKAKSIFDKKGIRCDVIRTPRNIGSGCGYSIAVTKETASVLALLDKHNIPHRSGYEL